MFRSNQKTSFPTPSLGTGLQCSLEVRVHSLCDKSMRLFLRSKNLGLLSSLELFSWVGECFFQDRRYHNLGDYLKLLEQDPGNVWLWGGDLGFETIFSAVQYRNLELKDNHESSRTSLALDTSNAVYRPSHVSVAEGFERPSVQKHTSYDSEAATRDRRRVSDEVNSRSGKAISPPSLP